jgi:hypothetical protein
MGEWKDISTAPKNGDQILVTDARSRDTYQVVFWDDLDTGWCWCTPDGPRFHREAFTHWQTLDAQPAAQRDMQEAEG